MDKILIALPAYNEGKVLTNVIKSIRKEGFKDILVIDDCSKDNTFKIAKENKTIILRHVINRGAGAATSTAINYAKMKKYDYLVLLDSDGQHDPKDIKKLLKYSKTHNFIIGSRMINPKGMPLSRKILNSIGSIITAFFFGTYVKDSQSGFKVLDKKAINRIKISFDRFEFCSEMIGEISRNQLKVKEVPIKVIYTDHSQSKGQSIGNGFRMVTRFIFRI
jgi:glycosyltransferase involved in cell wall biosynthesis